MARTRVPPVTMMTMDLTQPLPPAFARPSPTEWFHGPDPRFPERPRAGGGAASRGSRRRERANQGAGGPETKPPPGTTTRTTLARPLTHAFTCPLCLQDGATALMQAAQFGQPSVVDMLLQAGADKELTNKVGWTGTESRPCDPLCLLILPPLSAGRVDGPDYGCCNGPCASGQAARRSGR